MLFFSQTKKQVRQCNALLKEAQFSLDEEDYQKAWMLYNQVLKLEPKEEKAGVNAALCAYSLNYMADSVLFLKDNLAKSSIPDASYYLAWISHHEKAFDKAISLLTAYQLVNPKQRIHTDEQIAYLSGMCINARTFYANPRRSVVKNMGPTINSIYPDYAPIIMPDESIMFFTSKREGSSENRKNGDNQYYEDIYFSNQVEGIWQQAKNAGEPLNSSTNDGCVAISHDGQRMLVYRTAADIVGGDLYETQMGLTNKWEPLKLLGQEINSSYVESSACFSSDTLEFYFSSDRPGGFGGKDLYRIKKLPTNKWSMPYNLGPTVNTKYDEDAPFLHPDGVTLYFSSKGHNSMGYYDVFSSILNKENNLFGTAENLGYPINDIHNDIFFVLSVDAQRAYYSSQKDESLGSTDIYKVETRFGENDLNVQIGHALIDQSPARVKISLRDDETDQVCGTFYSNSDTGKFILILNPLKSYTATLDGEGFETKIIKITSRAFINFEKDMIVHLSKESAQ